MLIVEHHRQDQYLRLVSTDSDYRLPFHIRLRILLNASPNSDTRFVFNITLYVFFGGSKVIVFSNGLFLKIIRHHNKNPCRL
uniref:Uncharacterized protein n=1 Tax=Lactuca sativa TaxID=4236 RepID=A0A9R1W603_LACSA|nr:hypothetical protein LSAT_V11C300118270 [Lactuca sativa]